MTDTGVCIQPNPNNTFAILGSTLDVEDALGVTEPRVPVVAAIQSVVDRAPETSKEAELRRQSRAGACPDYVVQGPLSFDLAYAADAADK